MSTRVGITHIAHHLPEGRMTAEDLAARTGLDPARVRDELGILEKPVGREGESALDFAVEAGRRLLADHDPASIDLLIYATGSMPDHPLWWGVYKLHERLGLKHARMLEVQFGCVGSLHALELAKSHMVANPKVNRAIVIGAEGYHFSNTVGDYTNPHNEPMFIFSDGAAAALVESDRVATLPNALGEFAFRVDSRHHGEVSIPAGGARRPTSPETVAAGLHRVQLAEKAPQELRRFGVRYVQQYLAVIEEALRASGHDGPPDFVLSNQLKPALMQLLLGKLGLGMDRTVYTMPHWGHMGAADILLGLETAMAEGRLKPGQTAAIASSGSGFSWGAAALEVL